jgi:hypothetical protein
MIFSVYSFLYGNVFVSKKDIGKAACEISKMSLKIKGEIRIAKQKRTNNKDQFSRSVIAEAKTIS